MYIALAALIALHGLAHMVGFAAPFGYLKDSPPLDSLFFNRVTLPDAAMKAIGILWLGTVILFVVAAVGIIRRESWWTTMTLAACVVSSVLTIAFLPYAKIGLAVNVALFAFLYLNRSTAWIPGSA